jgi:hypothetical protein
MILNVIKQTILYDDFKSAFIFIAFSNSVFADLNAGNMASNIIRFKLFILHLNNVRPTDHKYTC